jgi:hypothetical protein
MAISPFILITSLHCPTTFSRFHTQPNSSVFCHLVLFRMSYHILPLPYPTKFLRLLSSSPLQNVLGGCIELISCNNGRDVSLRGFFRNKESSITRILNRVNQTKTTKIIRPFSARFSKWLGGCTACLSLWRSRRPEWSCAFLSVLWCSIEFG